KVRRICSSSSTTSCTSRKTPENGNSSRAVPGPCSSFQGHACALHDSVPKIMSQPEAQFEFVPQMSAIEREAGTLLMGYFRSRVKIEYKGEADLVTEADRASEKLILERIRRHWPSHDVIGEEGARIETGGDYRWYVDPLDGTTNFAHGFPVFCVSLGLAFQGKRKAAVVYDPTRDELFAAERGQGAVLNGEKMSVSKTPKLQQSLVGTGFPSHKRHKNPNIY